MALRDGPQGRRMKLSYRARRRLRRLGIAVLIAALAALILWLCWVVWLDRYVVYTRDGARLDFSASAEDLQEGEAAVPPDSGATVAIQYAESLAPTDPDHSLSQIAGYVIDIDALLEGLDTVREEIARLPRGTAVLVDVKSAIGNYFYSSKQEGAKNASGIDPADMDALIAELTGGEFYVIARVPAFRDRNYGEAHTEYGLATSGGYLWSDDQGCYWLDPGNSGTVTHLVSLASELRRLGFDEVVFSEFRFPDTDQFVYSSEQSQGDILAKAAASLVSASASDTFAVSFQTADRSFSLPEGRSRLYLADVEASAAGTVASGFSVVDPEARLVFLADSGDTRFDAYSVLRPLSTARQ